MNAVFGLFMIVIGASVIYAWWEMMNGKDK